jgi:hypothetical protein
MNGIIYGDVTKSEAYPNPPQIEARYKKVLLYVIIF